MDIWTQWIFFQQRIYNATAANATAPPRASIGAPVICDIPPVLVDEVIDEVAVCDAVVSELLVVLPLVRDATSEEAEVDPVALAVTVTGRELMSLLAKVIVCVPGKLAAEPLSISVQVAVVVPPMEQIMRP